MAENIEDSDSLSTDSSKNDYKHVSNETFWEKAWYKHHFVEFLLQDKSWMEANMLAKQEVLLSYPPSENMKPYNRIMMTEKIYCHDEGIMTVFRKLRSSYKKIFERDMELKTQLLLFGLEEPPTFEDREDGLLDWERKDFEEKTCVCIETISTLKHFLKKKFDEVYLDVIIYENDDHMFEVAKSLAHEETKELWKHRSSTGFYYTLEDQLDAYYEGFKKLFDREDFDIQTVKSFLAFH